MLVCPPHPIIQRATKRGRHEEGQSDPGRREEPEPHAVEPSWQLAAALETEDNCQELDWDLHEHQ